MSKPNRFDGLLHDICVGWGFCGCVSKSNKPKHVTLLIPNSGSVTAQQFAEWVIQSDWPWDDYKDSLYLEFRDRWFDAIAGLFVKHMGADVIDASLPKSED